MLLLFSGVLNLALLNDLIYSILIGNIPKSKHRYKKGWQIAHQYNFIKRISQTYISNHITLYRRDYNRFMCFKCIYFIGIVIYPILLFVVKPLYSHIDFLLKLGIFLSASLGVYLGFHFNLERKTKYER